MPTDWLPFALGALLGLGGLLAWRGFRLVADKSRVEADRRKGFWWLNVGLALAAVSMVAFTLAAKG